MNDQEHTPRESELIPFFRPDQTLPQAAQTNEEAAELFSPGPNPRQLRPHAFPI